MTDFRDPNVMGIPMVIGFPFARNTQVSVALCPLRANSDLPANLQELLAKHDLPQPFPLFGDRLVPAPSRF
jgi:hypothetical protein